MAVDSIFFGAWVDIDYRFVYHNAYGRNLMGKRL
jgi:hypothetical protein